MEMYYIEFVDFTLKRAAQRRCPIEPSEQRTRKISHLNAFQINWESNWHGAVSRPINVRSKNLDFMLSRRQRLAEAMGRKDWPSIAHSGQVARDDVKDTHKTTFPRPALICDLGLLLGTLFALHLFRDLREQWLHHQLEPWSTLSCPYSKPRWRRVTRP